MKVSIDQLIAKEVHPVKKGVKDELKERMKVLVQMAEKEQEDAGFFKSPSAYLQKLNLLDNKEVEIAEGVKIDLVNDEQIKAFVRDLREKVKGNGRINVNEMLSDNNSSLEYKKMFLYNTSVLWTYTYFWTKTKTKSSGLGLGLGLDLPDDIIYIDDIYMGRLSSPELKKDINKYVSKHLTKKKSNTD